MKAISKSFEKTKNSCEKIAYLAVDIGTTNLKCSLYDENLNAISSHSCKVKLNICTRNELIEC